MNSLTFHSSDSINEIVFKAVDIYSDEDRYVCQHQIDTVAFEDTSNLDITRMLYNIYYSLYLLQFDATDEFRFGHMKSLKSNFPFYSFNYNIKSSDIIDLHELFKKINIIMDDFKTENIKRYKPYLGWIPTIGLDIDTKESEYVDKFKSHQCKIYESENGYHIYFPLSYKYQIIDVIKRFNEYGIDPRHIACQFVNGDRGFVFTEQYVYNPNDNNIEYKIEKGRQPCSIDVHTLKRIEINKSIINSKIIDEFLNDYVFLTDVFSNSNIPIYYRSDHKIIVLYLNNHIVTNDPRLLNLHHISLI